MLQSDLCDYSDAYIAEGTITITDPKDTNYKKELAFKNNAPIISCTSKINNTFIDNAEGLDIVMPMYIWLNLIEYSKNYSKTSGSLWNYYRDEPNSGAKGNINYSIKDSKSFDYKTSITGKLEVIYTKKKKLKIVVPLKHLSNFWRTLDISLINCELSVVLTWSEKCLITSKATKDANSDANLATVTVNNPTYATFKITDTKLYVLVVTLSTEDDNKLLEQLKLGFKRAIRWNKYRSETTNQVKTNNLNYIKINNVNSLYLIIGKVDGYIEEKKWKQTFNFGLCR